MTQTVLNLKDWLLDQSSGDGGNTIFSDELRSKAVDTIKAGKFPTRKDEEWRYTPVKELLAKSVSTESLTEDLDTAIENAKQALPEAWHLVFIDGSLSPDHSDNLKELKGLSFSQITDPKATDMVKLESRVSAASWSDDNVFKDLNIGLSRTASQLLVAKDSVISHPVHLLHIRVNSGSVSVATPLVFIDLEANSKITIIEQYLTLPEQSNFNFPLTFMQLGQGSKLVHYKLGMESSRTEHISNTHAQVASDASLTAHQYLLGSNLSRTNTEVILAEPGAEVVLRGIYLGEKKQHLDIRTYIDHAAPHCVSNQHYRGILNDQARGVFNGLVLVQRDAQHTDAQQSNKNLLLSDEARVDSKPQLEIFADDVKCAHGATVGQLDQDALFYLQSRAISKNDAKLMLTKAFTAEVTADIEIESLRSWVEDAIINRLNKLPADHV